MCFQNTLPQNIHYHSKIEKLGHSEKILHQLNSETQKEKKKPQFC